MSNSSQRTWKDWIILPYWYVLYYSALIAFFLGIWFLNIIALPLYFFSKSEFSKSVTQFFIKALTKLYVEGLRLTRELHVTFSRSKLIDEMNPSILIANHPSSFDAPIILSRTNRVTCIFKAALKKNLLLANTAKLAGFIPNDLGIDTIKQASQSLKKGSHILIFPEGTRTVAHPLNPLNTSFLLIARRANVPVRFITIHTKSNLMGKGQHFLKLPTLPSIFTFRVGPEFTFSMAQSFSQLARYIRAYFEFHLQREQEEDVFESLWPKSLSFHFQPEYFSARIDSTDFFNAVTSHGIKTLTNEWLLAFGFISSELDWIKPEENFTTNTLGSGFLNFEFYFKRDVLIRISLKGREDEIISDVEFSTSVQG